MMSVNRHPAAARAWIVERPNIRDILSKAWLSPSTEQENKNAAAIVAMAGSCEPPRCCDPVGDAASAWREEVTRVLVERIVGI